MATRLKLRARYYVGPVTLLDIVTEIQQPSSMLQDYVVDSVTLHYRLVGGKYERDHNQLAVQSTSRFFLNKYLDQLYTTDSNTAP